MSATYSASITALVPAAAATDIFTISGAANFKIQVLRIVLGGVATAATLADVKIVKRSTLDTGGTSSNPTKVAHATGDVAQAILTAYTANPGALGTLVGDLFSRKVFLPATGTPLYSKPTEFDFTKITAQGEVPPILSTVNDLIGVNWNGATIAGNSLDVDITWLEW